MLKPRLTAKELWIDGALAHEYDICGLTLTIHDSARTALLVIEAIGDQSLLYGDKIEVMVRLLFAKPEEIPPERSQELLDAVVWEIVGIDLLGTRETPQGGSQAFDWVEDSTRIKASLLMAYGLGWEEASRKFTYAELCDLLGMLGEADCKTPFAEAVYYRTAKPPALTPQNGEYVKAWKASREHYKLHTEYAAMEERKREDAQASAAFESLWKAAMNG